MEPDEKTVRSVGPIWRELFGGLWHTTHPERFLEILKSRAILPEPEIRDKDRFGTAQGRKHYPYVRYIGGVSLFDFRAFDPESYKATYPSSNWRMFVPYRRDWYGALWIEIDSEQVGAQVVSGPDLLTKWKKGGDLGHNIMPIIEAAHLGPVPLNAFKKALFIRAGDDGQFHELEMTEFDRPAYKELLNGWRDDCKKANG